MKLEDIENAQAALEKLLACSDSTGARIEIMLDRLASALIPLAEKPPRKPEIVQVLSSLNVDIKTRRKLKELCGELQGAIESRNYGDEDELDDNEMLGGLIQEFYDCLTEQLENWEDDAK